MHLTSGALLLGPGLSARLTAARESSRLRGTARMGKGVVDSRHEAWMGTTALSASDYSHEIIRHRRPHRPDRA